jgi:hypothetical protein
MDRVPVGERAKLHWTLQHRFAVSIAIVVASVSCIGVDDAPAPCYEASSRRLVRLDADVNGDGVIEQRTYLDGNVPFRTEIDTNADGRVDRWEYVDRRAQVIKVGTSSLNDGREDQWVFPASDDGLLRVDRSTERTSRVDRREFYRGEIIERAEEDTNQDGVFDKWERFDGGVVREIAYDTTHSTGRADRRLVYDAQGKYLRLEEDPDGDGRFQTAETPASGVSSVRE